MVAAVQAPLPGQHSDNSHLVMLSRLALAENHAISTCAAAWYLCPHATVLEDLKDFSNRVGLDSHRVQGALCIFKEGYKMHSCLWLKRSNGKQE